MPKKKDNTIQIKCGVKAPFGKVGYEAFNRACDRFQISRGLRAKDERFATNRKSPVTQALHTSH